MQFITITLALFSLSLSIALPQDYDREQTNEIIPRFPYNPLNYVRTRNDDRIHTDSSGTYNFDIETENDIKISEAGQAAENSDSIVKAGSYSFLLPDGNLFEMKYVADENGFQPESSYLPVAPVFPHPIPQFVLDQIAFAERERAEREARGDFSNSQYDY